MKDAITLELLTELMNNNAKVVQLETINFESFDVFISKICLIYYNRSFHISPVSSSICSLIKLNVLVALC